jgi:hypothetical protein
MHCVLTSDNLPFIWKVMQSFLKFGEFSLDITRMIRYFGVGRSGPSAKNAVALSNLILISAIHFNLICLAPLVWD